MAYKLLINSKSVHVKSEERVIFVVPESGAAKVGVLKRRIWFGMDEVTSIPKISSN